MKPAGMVGVILIIIGMISLVWGGITFTKREKVIDLGPIRATAEKKEMLPFPPVVLGGICLVGGVVLVLAGGRKT